MFLATGCGLGYLPIAPGSWGALGGVLLALLFGNFWTVTACCLGGWMVFFPGNPDSAAFGLWLTLVNYFPYVIVLLAVAGVGVWASAWAERYLGRVDPRSVVIDEVSGQLIAYLGALNWTELMGALRAHSAWRLQTLFHPLTLVVVSSAPNLANWKYLLAGFILFRGFDTWKPFPASSAEHLHGGWGVMADDWVAGIYAALALGIARWLGF